MDESKHVDKNMSDLNDGKLIVNKRINDPEQPPSKNVAVINLSDKDHTGENELVRTIFQGYGPGSYTVLLTEKGRKHMDLVWKVEIYEKEGDKIPFRTKENHFRNVIVTREPPWTGRRKYVPE